MAFEWPSGFGIRSVYFGKESGCLQDMVKKNKVKMAAIEPGFFFCGCHFTSYFLKKEYQNVMQC